MNLRAFLREFTMAENILYYGDNLEILQRYIKDESVDLVYLDPPFNSNRNYEVFLGETKIPMVTEIIK